MKLAIDIKGLAQVREQVKDFSERRMRAAAATALTRTAVEVRDVVKADLTRSLDRPTPYTVRQVRYVGATAARLSAGVGLNIEAIQDERGNVVRYSDMGAGATPASKYLQYSTGGGQRALKRFEKALQAKGSMPKGWVSVPGDGARRDAYGNVSRGQIAQIISQVGTELLSGYTNTPQGLTAKRRAQRKAGGQFIAVLPGQKGTTLKPGIYQRETIGRNLTPVLLFVRSASYRQRWDFDGVAASATRARLGPNVDRAIAEQLQRLRARGGS